VDEGLGELLPSQRDALDVISRAELRLERMIEDLIQFSIASRGELSIKLTTVETRKLTRVALEQSQYKAKAKGITIEEKIVEDLPHVYCDEEKITWVLNQFLDNGIKFTPAGGKVTLAVNRNGQHLTFIVSDTGIGIPQERIDEIFEPFHQLDGSSTRKYSGTGLGLALSSRIIEAHMSKIEVQSHIGEGTSFAFSLPTRD
jgi:signal transduction histidine kinase